ncbi:MAG: kelch repeat-containing protein [Acidobacteriota bacterium]
MSGSSTADQPGIYGSRGTPAPSNIPGARENAVSWTDRQGNFWLFGGFGYDSAGTQCYLNDLWKFDPATGQWAWISGSSTIPYSSGQSGICSNAGQPGIYGTSGTPSSTNTPGSRSNAVSWTDAGGNLWLFGGIGVDANGAFGYLDDLWVFSPTTNEWACMGGNSTLQGRTGSPGLYSSWMEPAPTSYPGARQLATAWTDSSGNLWLFGGLGLDSTGTLGYLNDLWEFSPTIGQWAWMGGSDVLDQPGTYGALRTPAFMNTPASRDGALGWTDKSGNLWLFGGYAPGYSTGPNSGMLEGLFNDLWEYQPAASGLPLASKPTFSPDSGTYTPGQLVSLSDATPGANIFYFVDGDTSPAPYGQPIALSSSGTIHAVASAPGYANSAVASANYTIPVTDAPTFSVAAGTYSTPQAVTLSSATPGATIYYAINGTPTPLSTMYSGPVNISASGTLAAIAVAPGYDTSAVAAVSYTIWPTPAVKQWAWMGGVNVNEFAPGIYGTLGVSSAKSFPGARRFSSTWADKAGNLWLFGGDGFDAGDGHGLLNDLWKFTPSTNQWAWMGGSNTTGATTSDDTGRSACFSLLCGQRGVYGTLGNSASGNVPGGREGAASWADAPGNFWMFGGFGYDSIGTRTELNDLWEFSPSSDEWTWMGGSSTIDNTCFGSELAGFYCAGEPSVYGTFGAPATGNRPGARQGMTSWTDNKGNLWLFGGWGYDFDTKVQYYFDELWKFDPSTRQWAWMGGSNTREGSACFQNVNLWFPTCGEPGVSGRMATPSPGNIPGGRSGAASWTDSAGDLWLFGGYGFDVNGSFGDLNDLWEFSTSSNQWTWMGGNNTVPPCDGYQCHYLGTYGTLASPAAGDVPGGRGDAAAWKDTSGNVWLFSGFVNDFWEFNPSAVEWGWMGGTNEANCGVYCNHGMSYGTMGTPAASNFPGLRTGAATWTDSSGRFWLFGGYGSVVPDVQNYLNDFWEYQPSAPDPVPGFAVVNPNYQGFNNVKSFVVSAGTSGTTTINTVVADGFSGPITLSASNLPPGVTVSFSPAQVTGFAASTATFTASLAAVPGYYTVTLAGTSGGVTESTTATVTVDGPPMATFTLSASPSSISVSSGSQGSTTLTVSPLYGFNSPVSFSCSNLPPGATCTFTPATITPSGSAVTTQLVVAVAKQTSELHLESSRLLSFASLFVAFFFFFGLKRRRLSSLLPFVGLVLLSSGSMSGCSGGGGGGNGGAGGGSRAPITSTVTVTGTAAGVIETTDISLTVN